jgi:Calpain family cysteine protease
MWVMLLEKAWAKVHGGYMNIDAGLTREALHDLTGAPTKTYFPKDEKEEAWAAISYGEFM